MSSIIEIFPLISLVPFPVSLPPPPPQFPGHGELLWGEGKIWREGSGSESRVHAVVRVLQRLQKRLGATEQEHLQREVSWPGVKPRSPQCSGLFAEA